MRGDAAGATSPWPKEAGICGREAGDGTGEEDEGGEEEDEEEEKV